MVKVTSGVRFDQDQYSAFEQSGLATLLRRQGVRRLWVGGLAQDVCVLETVLGGLREGFQMALILAATRPLGEVSGRDSVLRMRAAGTFIFAE